MLYEISRELETELVEQGAPFPVVYGPERVDTAGGLTTSERIVIERQRPGTDTYDAGKHRVHNPRQRHTVQTSGLCRIIVSSTLDGADVHDHERRQEKLRDIVLDAMDKVVGARGQQWRPTTGGLLSSDQLDGLETLKQWPGVVYEFRFTVARGTRSLDWAGADLVEVEFGGGANQVDIVSRTRAILAGAPDGTDPETACGIDP